MIEGCMSPLAYQRIHEMRVRGTPYSEMTYYECHLCGVQIGRGPGAFYGQKPPEPNYGTSTHEVRRIIREEIRAALTVDESHE